MPRMLAQLEEEASTVYNSIPFDLRMGQVSMHLTTWLNQVLIKQLLSSALALKRVCPDILNEKSAPCIILANSAMLFFRLIDYD